MMGVIFPIVLFALAVFFAYRIKKQMFVSTYRIILTAAFLASIYVAFGFGIQLWAMFSGESIKFAIHDFGVKYPDVLIEDFVSVSDIIANSSFWQGFARGLIISASAMMFLLLIPLKKVLKSPSKSSQINEKKNFSGAMPIPETNKRKGK